MAIKDSRFMSLPSGVLPIPSSSSLLCLQGMLWSEMQGLVRAVRSYQGKLKLAISQNLYVNNTTDMRKVYTRYRCVTSSHTKQHKGLENMNVADVLMTKGEEVGSWLWCWTNDTVYDAAKQMAQNNIGSLVILKPGDQQLIAGIITERDYMRKVIAQDRVPKYTRVGEIMTDKSKLIAVTSDTNILQAMQLMTENHIRHVPVIDGKVVGMISIVDVVHAVVEQQSGEVKHLNEFIKGEYY